jgi:hypothetical protein
MRVDLRPYLSRCCVRPLTLLALAACQRREGTPSSAEAMTDPSHGAAGGAPAAAGSTSSATTRGPQLVVYASDQRRLRGFLARPAGEYFCSKLRTISIPVRRRSFQRKWRKRDVRINFTQVLSAYLLTVD